MHVPPNGRAPRAALVHHRPRFLARLATLAAIGVFAPAPAIAAMAIVLPIEVVGENGTTASIVVDVPADRARDVRSLWMQIHGLSFAGMASVQVNQSAWTPLTNDTVAIEEPSRRYGGIGGGFF